ncbi:F-box protein At1g30200-like [Fagus crenata]
MDCNQEKHAANPFDRLPDDLLLLIFDNLLEAKYLVSCFLVSKRFASLIPQTNTQNIVFLIREPPPISQSTQQSCADTSDQISFKNDFSFTNIIRKVINKLSFSMICSPGDQVQETKASNVSKMIQELKCLEIQTHSTGEDKFPFATGLYMWKAFFGAEFRYSLTLIAVHFNDNPLENTSTNISTGDPTVLAYCCGPYLREGFRRYRYVQDFVSKNQLLPKKIVAYDSKKRGKLCMGEKDIEECRISLGTSVMQSGPHHLDKDKLFIGKSWYVPVLDSPSHRYKMKGVMVFLIGPVGQPLIREEDLLKGFEDDEEEQWKIFNEAVREIIFNNNIKKTIWHVSSSTFW